jgi:hypothetical protein
VALGLPPPRRHAGSAPRAPSARRWRTRRRDTTEHGLEVAGLGLRQEADLAEVDPEQRDVDLGDGPGGAQERAVAAQDHEDIGPGQLAQEAVEVAGLGLPVLDVAHAAPADGPGGRSTVGLDRRVVREADRG